MGKSLTPAARAVRAAQQPARPAEEETMKSYHHFPEALAAWRKLGGAMNYCCAFSDAPETWQVWEELADLVEAIEISPRRATIHALQAGGLSDAEIAAEMADFHD